MNPILLQKANNLGFVAMGFSRPEKPFFFAEFSKWLEGGNYGGLNWLTRHVDIREDPRRLLEDCRTVISLAYPYPSEKPYTSDGFAAARYTDPKNIDYHSRLKKLARDLEGLIKQEWPGSRTRVCVDSAPILERSFAYTAGIGFIGKNNMLIVPGYGSYVFLTEILTSALITNHETLSINNQCGSCNRCIDACPSGALVSPYHLDVSRCLSYLTIEHPDMLDCETGSRMADCFFGCDICQEVCPFNEGEASKEFVLPSTDEILEMGEEDFKEKFGKTAFARGGLEKLKGNIRAIKQQPHHSVRG